MSPQTISSDDIFRRHGFEIIPSVFSAEEIREWIKESERLVANDPLKAHGIRNLFGKSLVFCHLAHHPNLKALLQNRLRSPFLPVRAIFFNKLPEANWKVAWHQDLSIAVDRQLDVAGFGPWSIKDGVPHVQPPAEFLEQMVTVRVHLDDCTAENGALRVIPGSHQHGKISSEKMEDIRNTAPETTCVVKAGGVLMMRPLLLHASSPAIRPFHRRVIHIEYAPSDLLPKGLKWHENLRNESFRPLFAWGHGSSCL